MPAHDSLGLMALPSWVELAYAPGYHISLGMQTPSSWTAATPAYNKCVPLGRHGRHGY